MNHKDLLLSDQRGAVAFEMLIVWLFMMMSLLLPLADVAIAGFQFVSAWEALRAFGQYVQLHPPPDVTNTSSWTSTLPTTVAGYPISNVQVLCGDTNAGAVCSSSQRYVAHQVLFIHDDRHLVADGVKIGVVYQCNANPLLVHTALLRTLPIGCSMHNLLRCRRGSAAFATVVALVPLIGVVALGAEAGSWYVTKQHAQNAADAAAYSGGLTAGMLIMLHPARIHSQWTIAVSNLRHRTRSATLATPPIPARQCATSLPTGTSQTVQINTLTAWNGVNGNFVQATVSQQQPAYLAKVLGLSTVNIGATAIAQVDKLPKPPCVLALTGSISFQGSPNINAPNCGMASNDTAKDALNFTGGGMSINLGSLSAAGGCTGTASFCNTALTYRSPVTNPFSALDGALTTLCGANPTLPATCGLPTCDSRIGARRLHGRHPMHE